MNSVELLLITKLIVCEMVSGIENISEKVNVLETELVYCMVTDCGNVLKSTLLICSSFDVDKGDIFNNTPVLS